MSRIGVRVKHLRLRFGSSLVWGPSAGLFISALCYLGSLLWRAPLPLLWLLCMAGVIAGVLMLLDAGPGRESFFARAIHYGLCFGAASFSAHARKPSESLTSAIVFSILQGIFVSLVWRFYIYDPRKKTASDRFSRPLH